MRWFFGPFSSFLFGTDIGREECVEGTVALDDFLAYSVPSCLDTTKFYFYFIWPDIDQVRVLFSSCTV